VHSLGSHHLADVEVAIGVLVDGIDHIVVIGELGGGEIVVVQLGAVIGQVGDLADGDSAVLLVHVGDLTQIVVDLNHGHGLVGVGHVDLGLSTLAGVGVVGAHVAAGHHDVGRSHFLTVHIGGPVVLILVADGSAQI